MRKPIKHVSEYIPRAGQNDTKNQKTYAENRWNALRSILRALKFLVSDPRHFLDLLVVNLGIANPSNREGTSTAPIIVSLFHRPIEILRPFAPRLIHTLPIKTKISATITTRPKPPPA